MATPDITTVAPNGVVNLADSPSGLLDDAAFDALFPADAPTTVAAPNQAEPTQTQPTTTQPVVQTTQPSTTTTSPQGDEPFLKGDRSVYKTADAAVQGINQKDALIEQLRQRYALTTGIDPISGQPVGQSPQSTPTDYTANPQKYFTDLYEAAKASPEAYVGVQQKFLMDTLKPLAPVLQRAAREQAKETLKTELPDAPNFIGTPAYEKALNVSPQLKEAITAAENDYRYHSRLPELYKIAYLTGQGLQLPELLDKAKQTTVSTVVAATPPTQPTVRTTSQPTTTAPTQTTVRPNLKTLEGIKAVIAEAESRGAKLDF